MALLLEAFESVPETVEPLLARLEAKHWTVEILDALVRGGKITLADIEVAYQEVTKEVGGQ
jgi:hypothetical protein